VYHLDPYAQALSKLEHRFDQDLEDVRAIDPAAFRARVERAFR
jgi:hypothetical protein